MHVGPDWSFRGLYGMAWIGWIPNLHHIILDGIALHPSHSLQYIRLR